MSAVAFGTPVGPLTIEVERGALSAVRFEADPAAAFLGGIPVTRDVAYAIGTRPTGDLDDLHGFLDDADTVVRAGDYADADKLTITRTVGELGGYFCGLRLRFDIPLASGGSKAGSGDDAGFRARVHRFLPRIRYGTTMTYGEVAEAVGHPKAARAVGSACGANPLPIVVPCHRVLPARGSIFGNVGGYAGGPDIKQTLLLLEEGIADSETL